MYIPGSNKASNPVPCTILGHSNVEKTTCSIKPHKQVTNKTMKHPNCHHCNKEQARNYL